MQHDPKTRQLNGESRPSRINNKPQPTGVPMKPRGMTPHASKLWDRVTPRLIELGLATELDAPALEALCFWWSVWVESKTQLEQATDYSTTATGRIVMAVNRSWDCFKRLALQFGMTPAARNGMSIEGHTLVDDEEFFSK